MSVDLVSEGIQRELAATDAFLTVVSESIRTRTKKKPTVSVRDDIEHDMMTLISLMTMIDECSRRYTSAVANDLAPYNEELDERIKRLWNIWVRLAAKTRLRVLRSDHAFKINRRLYKLFLSFSKTALRYQKENFDHHANAIISKYEFPLASFLGNKFPREIWDSEE
jgi:hypothetical protein